MATRRNHDVVPPKSRTRRQPAVSPDARQRHLTNLAYDLAETQLTEGTASAQVISHFLKESTTRSELERQKIEYENELLRARTESIRQQENLEKLFKDAMQAMGTYQGNPQPEDEDFDDD